jgi:hypothetical protein
MQFKSSETEEGIILNVEYISHSTGKVKFMNTIVPWRDNKSNETKESMKQEGAKYLHERILLENIVSAAIKKEVHYEPVMKIHMKEAIND